MSLALAGLAVAIVVAALVVAMALRRKGSANSAAENRRLDELVSAHRVLEGQVKAASDSQIAIAAALNKTIAESSAALTGALNDRLESTQARLGTTLEASAKETAESLGRLVDKLATIDEAQKNITGLSQQVVSLQHVLADKQARGAFGEIQLADIVRDALPASAYTFQAKLCNGARVDCLIRLPKPPGPIAIDSKFALTSYQGMLDAGGDETARKACAKGLADDVKKHIKKIAEDYLIPGETAESALMFVPSEAVYAELYAHHPSVIAECQRARVYLVSPTTMMAVLTTIRAVLRDVQMREQAGRIQIEVGKMLNDIRLLSDRVDSLRRHFDQAVEDVRHITISSDKVENRAAQIRDVEIDASEERPPALAIDTTSGDSRSEG